MSVISFRCLSLSVMVVKVEREWNVGGTWVERRMVLFLTS